MNEDVSNRTFNLMISTTKLTARTLFEAARRTHREFNSKMEKTSGTPKKGKQSVRSLLSQNQGLVAIDIADTDIKDFQKCARKYGIDYAIRKDRTTDPPKYMMFLKAVDSSTMEAALKEYGMSKRKVKTVESVLGRLEKMKAKARSIPKKIRNKTKGEPSL